MGDRRDEGRGATYWRARADALEADVVRLRRRLLALARALPPHLVPLLERDPETMPSWAPPIEDLVDWDQPTRLVAGEVEEELERLWAALPGPGDG